MARLLAPHLIQIILMEILQMMEVTTMTTMEEAEEVGHHGRLIRPAEMIPTTPIGLISRFLMVVVEVLHRHRPQTTLEASSVVWATHLI